MPRTTTVECSGCPPLRALTFWRTWSHQRSYLFSNALF